MSSEMLCFFWFPLPHMRHLSCPGPSSSSDEIMQNTHSRRGSASITNLGDETSHGGTYQLRVCTMTLKENPAMKFTLS